MIRTLTGITFATALFAAPFDTATAGQDASSASGETAPTPAPAPVAVPLRMLGDPAAPVTIDEYASFICDTCADWHTTVLPALVRDLVDTGQARIVFHDVVTPPWQYSMRAAAIGLCAAPDRFFDVAERLMDGLEVAMGDQEGATQRWYDAAIAASGRTEADINACLTSEATYDKLAWQQNIANTLGFTDLPVIRVNGQFVDDPTEAAVKAAVKAAPPAPEPLAAPETVAAPQPANAS